MSKCDDGVMVMVMVIMMVIHLLHDSWVLFDPPPHTHMTAVNVPQAFGVLFISGFLGTLVELRVPRPAVFGLVGRRETVIRLNLALGTLQVSRR